MPVSATFHSSMSQSKPGGGGGSGRTPKPSPTAASAPSEVTEAAFSRWKVELSNKLVVEQEKELIGELFDAIDEDDNGTVE